MGKFIDFTGKRFGRLIVLIRAPTENKKTRWLCKCDCGNEKVISSPDLVRGTIRSCGCLRRETSALKRIHGGRNTPLYHIWCAMRGRCYRPTDFGYKWYGARGITVCDEWRKDFKVFGDWAVANGYKVGLSIDRIDNDKGYYPENCRWATAKQQARNTRSRTRYAIMTNGATIAELAEIVNIPATTLHQRLKLGMPIEKLFYQGNLSLKNEKGNKKMNENTRFELADKLKALRDKKNDLESHVKAVNAEIESIQAELIADLLENNSGGFNHSGYNFTLVVTERHSADPMMKEEFYEVLRERGLMEMFSVNPNTLQGRVKEWIDENDGTMPNWLGDYIKTYEKPIIQIRKGRRV